MEIQNTYTAFDGNKLVCKGSLSEVVLRIKKQIGPAENSSVLIFNDTTGKVMDFNFHGSEKDVQKRLETFVTAAETPKDISGPGRPKLGVVSREVSLLPRHWEWLASQPGGASNALRKLVDDAKKKTSDVSSAKAIQERTYAFMAAIAGDLKGYEEALRALFKKDEEKFFGQMEEWPKDIKNHIAELSKPLFGGE